MNIISVLVNYLLIAKNTELAEERSTVKEGTKSWDKKILGLSAVTLIITYIVAGLDSGRFQWSPGFHWSINAVGTFLILLGEVIFLTAQKQNKFFSTDKSRIWVFEPHKSPGRGQSINTSA